MKTGSSAMSPPQSGMTNCDAKLEDAGPESVRSSVGRPAAAAQSFGEPATST